MFWGYPAGFVFFLFSYIFVLFALNYTYTALWLTVEVSKIWSYILISGILFVAGLWTLANLFLVFGVDRLIFCSWWVINDYTLFFQLLIIIVGLVMVTFFQHSITQNNRSFHFTHLIILGAILALMSLNCSNNLLCFGLSLEAVTWALFYFLFFIQTPATGVAAQQYFVTGLASAGLLFLSLIFIFWHCGSLDLIFIADFLATSTHPFTVQISFGLFFISLFVKIAVFPFHAWFLAVCEKATKTSLIFLLVFVKLVFFSTLYRVVLFSMFTILPSYSLLFQTMLVASLLVGTFLAFTQVNIPKFLGAASIPQMGFLLFFLVCPDSPGVFEKQLAYLFTYIFSIFVVLLFVLLLDMCSKACISGGLWFAFFVCLLSLAGVPPLAGFFTKTYILSALLENNLWFYAISCIVASAISAVYYLRLVKKFVYDSASMQANSDSQFLVGVNSFFAIPVVTLVLLWYFLDKNVFEFLSCITNLLY